MSEAEVIADLAVRLSPEYCRRLVTLLQQHEDIDDVTRVAIERAMWDESAASAAISAVERLRDEPKCISPRAFAVALNAAVTVARDTARRSAIDVVWTGPLSPGVLTRRSAAVLLELIEGAARELLVLSFASFRIADAITAFQAAARRGVKLHFVLESAEESGGRLRSGAGELELHHELCTAQFYVWPSEERSEGGVMHAKAIVADRRRVLVTSANLTERAIDSNIELGLLLDNALVANSIAEHVYALIAGGILRREIPHKGMTPYA